MQDTILNNRSKHKFVIENFEGPLDLLLYLISKNKMNIFDVSLSRLTDEYVKYLEEMSEMDLEITSEFIVMAATLLDIKGRKLLPELEPQEEEEVLSEEDIIAHIIEYKKYKEISIHINELYKEYFGSFSKPFEKIKFETQTKYSGNPIYPGDLFNIYKIMLEKNLNKINNKAREVEKIALYEKVTVQDKVKQIVKYLKSNENMVFNEVFDSNVYDNLEVVTAFLGALELSKLKQVFIEQKRLFSDINIVKNQDSNFKVDLSVIEG
ncbi:MAG: segregation/condensation protein A [Clostridia bacterium]